jgi:hypothetical protein
VNPNVQVGRPSPQRKSKRDVSNLLYKEKGFFCSVADTSDYRHILLNKNIFGFLTFFIPLLVFCSNDHIFPLIFAGSLHDKSTKKGQESTSK